ncbi:unnamed protein product [Sympodiomycopsis kandeliae]
MYARIQHANTRGGGAFGGDANGRQGHNIAGSALRKAGLMDGDSGMTSASRRGAGRGRGGGASSTAGPSRSVDNSPQGNQAKGRKARDRANPLAARLNRPTAKASLTGTSDPNVRGQAFGIRGAAKGKGKGRGQGSSIPGAVESTPATFNTQGTIAVLRRLLSSRWNGASSFLNLSNLKDDPILKEGRVVPPGQPKAHKDIGTVIFKLASELYPQIATISLGQNDFKSLIPILTLPQHIPNLQNLSLENNDLKWTKDLAVLNGKSGKFAGLRELVLTGNPMQTNAASALNEEGYRAEVISTFPTLTLLDSVDVSQKESAIAQLPSGGKKSKGDQVLGPETPIRNFPVQTKAGFSDEAANGIVPSFLHRFFTLFDSSRESPELRSVYASNATWTIVVNTSIPPRARSAGYQNSKDLPRQKDLTWSMYLKSLTNHNIMSLGAKSASKGCPIGAGTILAMFKKMPATRHPITDASKFVVDSWILPNTVVGALVGSKQGTQPEKLEKPDAVLFINVKGEFAEGPSFGVRSFERTFMVAPASPESPAAKAGWPCTILSEQLTVKNYTGIDGWKVDSLPVGDVTTSVVGQMQLPQAAPQAQPLPQGTLQPQAQPGPAPTPAPGINEQQHNLALQFSAETRLTYPFAVQCLAENNWDGHAAMNVFTNLKNAGGIPPDAFIPA